MLRTPACRLLVNVWHADHLAGSRWTHSIERPTEKVLATLRARPLNCLPESAPDQIAEPVRLIAGVTIDLTALVQRVPL